MPTGANTGVIMNDSRPQPKKLRFLFVAKPSTIRAKIGTITSRRLMALSTCVVTGLVATAHRANKGSAGSQRFAVDNNATGWASEWKCGAPLSRKRERTQQQPLPPVD